MQNEVKSALPALSGCMVVGDRRKFLTILLTLHLHPETHELVGPSKAAGESIGSAAKTIEEVKACPLVRRGD
jgi:hypothetical protein